MGKQFFWVAALMLAAMPAGAETLSFAPLPMEAPETVVQQFRPMLTQLEQQLGVQIRIDFSADYAEILRKFETGAVDIAYLGPLPYLELRERFAQAQPLVHFLEASGKPTYTCAIVAPVDGLASLKGLTGKKVALTQPLSTCGYLSTSGLMREAGADIEQNAYRYLDKHDEVALAVTRGEFDLGGVKTAIGKKYAHMGLAVLAETAPLPSFALIANGRTVSPERAKSITQALTALDAKGKDRDILQTWGENLRHGAVPAYDSDYDALRKLRGVKPIPQTGNY